MMVAYISICLLSSSCTAQNLAPVFSNHIYIIPVQEDHPVSTDVYTVEATDSSTITYSLDILGSAYFSIEATSGVITLTRALDRELVNRLEFNVFADDSLLQSSAVILIIVGDSNDNAPQFTNTPYRGDVMESTATGESVLQVSAEDDVSSQIFLWHIYVIIVVLMLGCRPEQSDPVLACISWKHGRNLPNRFSGRNPASSNSSGL